MSDRELMTRSKIHEFGVQIVAEYCQKDGFEIESINSNQGYDPQIIASKDRQVAHIVVRTDAYPNKGALDDPALIDELIAQARASKATCYFASVGIANSEGQGHEEMGIPISGAGYYVAYNGLVALTDIRDQMSTMKSDENWRDRIRESLLASYKPREATGVACARCGNRARPLSFHVIEYYQDENDSLPTNFVPTSSSMRTIRGCFPVCVRCAKPCRKCGLPIRSEKVEEFFLDLRREYGSGVVGGNGCCEHMHFSLLFHAVFKRLFRIGRFGRKPSG